MARKKSSSRKSRFSIIWLLITLLSGGGISGYFNPDWPIVGYLFQSLRSKAIDRSTQESHPVDVSTLPTSARRRKLVSTRRRPATPQRGRIQRPAEKLLIASFNIQVFGESKLGKPDVVTVLAEIVRHFDIVAIQEVRAKSDDILPRFLKAINSDGSRYDYLIGPRLGRSVSTEQYAFIFDTTRVEHDPTSVGTLKDRQDLLHREPMVTRFRPRTSTPDRAFTFWLVNTHTDPDEVKQEVDVLADVFQLVQSRPYEDDVILLGDLNANDSQLGRLGGLPGIKCIVRGAMTNTRQTKAYDNILVDDFATAEYTGRWGVFDFERHFGMTREEALKVSDHFPVWAEFHIWEAPEYRRSTDRARVSRY